MEKILPYHEMSIFAINGRKIVRMVEVEPGDAFLPVPGELLYVWQFPGLGAFDFNRGTNFLLGNDFMYVSPESYLEFDDSFTDSKTFVLVVEKEEFLRYYTQNPPSFLKIDEIQALLDFSSSHSHYLIHYPDSRPLIRVMDFILADFRDFIMPIELILADVLRLLNTLANVSHKAYQPLMMASKKDPVLYTMKRIREDYQTITLDAVAKELNYSKNYISDSMRKVVGMGFEDMRAFRREVIGSSLLKNNNLSIQQVAEQLGFDTYAGFFKFWKRRTGLSPREYRARLRHLSDYTVDYTYSYGGTPLEQ